MEIIDNIEVPETLKECYDILNIVAEEDYDIMQDYSEKDFIALTHHTTGRWIRNNWGLWQGNGNLCKFFKKLGIHHPDDMSSIIFSSFYRQYHGLPINIDEQVEHYRNYWTSCNINPDTMKEIKTNG